MEKTTPVKNQRDFKAEFIQFYRKGHLSLILLALMFALVLLILVGRFKNAGLLKNLSMATFNQNPDLTHDFSSLSSFYLFDLVLIVLTMLTTILYFIAWFLRTKKIRLDAVITYTLIGFLVASGFYLAFSRPIAKQSQSITAAQQCILATQDEQELPESCADAQDPEPLVLELGKTINDNYFKGQTAYLAMVFFLILSILQLLMDRVKKILLIKKGRRVTHEQYTTI